jgi:DNA polymerase-4
MRSIIHLHIPAFPVAVERARRAELRTRPVIVGATTSRKGRVVAASPEAHEAGIKKGMPMSAAMRRMRDAVAVDPDRELYSYISRRIAEKLFFFSPSVEPARYGHFFVDVSGTKRLFGCAADCAARMKRAVLRELGLPGVLGIAGNKLVSFVAARILRPGLEICDVPSGSEAQFLAPLRVQLLPSVSKVEGVLVDDLNVRVIRELACIELELLAHLFGRRGTLLYREARGVDESPVRPPRKEPSVLAEESLTDETNDDAHLLSILYRLTEDLCAAMRERSAVPGALTLYIRYADQYEMSRTVALDSPQNHEGGLFTWVESLFFKVCTRRQCVRHMALELTCLSPAHIQMSLFPGVQEAKASTGRAIHAIRERYGLSAIACGRTL